MWLQSHMTTVDYMTTGLQVASSTMGTLMEMESHSISTNTMGLGTGNAILVPGSASARKLQVSSCAISGRHLCNIGKCN